MVENKRTTKERLDELRDLLRGDYITEDEFRVARVGILREGGIDITDDFDHGDEEEVPRGCGCACFMATLVLIAVCAAGVFFAAPKWPEPYGGDYARTAREWAVNLYTEIVTSLQEIFPSLIPDAHLQAPAPTEPARAEPEEQAGPVGAEPVGAEPASSGEAAAVSGEIAVPLPERAAPPAERSSLPVIDPRIFAMPDAMPDVSVPDEDSNVTVVEIPSSLPEITEPAEVEEDPLQRGFISARNARVRSAPDPTTNNNVVGWGRSGDRLLILEERTGKDGAKWYNVRYADGSKQGWVSGTLVTLD